jgi:hypothetical protein
MNRPATGGPRMTRETRLLLVTIVVSAAVLLLLARFRFPESDRPTAVAPVTQSLERLAARATYGELASIIAQLEARIAPTTVVLRLAADPPVNPLVPARAALDLPQFVPALRVRDDLALAAIHPDARLYGVVGYPDAVPVIVAADRVRRVALVRVPTQPATLISVAPREEGGWTSRYVVAVEAARGGPSVRPIFLGRTTPLLDPHWEEPLLELGGTTGAQPGSIIFSLDGRLTGLLIEDENAMALVPASALLAAADELAEGRVSPAGDLGLHVQPLTPMLMAATGAEQGAVVSHVDPDGPAAQRLAVGDVIDALNDRPVYSAEGFALRVTRLEPNTDARVRFVRQGELLESTLPVRTFEGRSPGPRRMELGLELRTVGTLGAEVIRVRPASMAAHAGVLEGDVVTQAGPFASPTPQQVARAYQDVTPGRALLLGVNRLGEPLVLAIEKP